MAIQLPDPLVTPTSNDSQAFMQALAAIQRDLDALAQTFPIHAGLIRDGAVGTTQLAANAATKLHTTTATTSSPTTTSAVAATLAEMTITADFGGNPILVMFSGDFTHSTAGNWILVELFDAGVSVATTPRGANDASANYQHTMTVTHGYTPAAGSRTLDIRWSTAGATATATLTRRNLSILELRR